MKKMIIVACTLLLIACEPNLKPANSDSPYLWKQKFMHSNAVILTDEQTGEKYAVTYYNHDLFKIMKVNVPSSVQNTK